MITQLKSECPYCFFVSDLTAQLAGKECRIMPRPGDVSTCIECGKTAKFEESLALRPMTDDEWDALSPDLRTKLRMVRTFTLLRKRDQLTGGVR